MIKRNNHAFSLIEILAVILIATTVIIPLLTSLTGNYEVNTRMIRRSSASLVSVATVQGFQNMYYDDIREILEDVYIENAGEPEFTDLFLQFNQGNCEGLREPQFPSVGEAETVAFRSNRKTCEIIFDIESINISFDSDQFQVYITPFTVTTDQRDALLNADVPIQVLDEFAKIPTSDEPLFSILRMTVYIRYGDRSGDVIIRDSLLTREGVAGE